MTHELADRERDGKHHRREQDRGRHVGGAGGGGQWRDDHRDRGYRGHREGVRAFLLKRDDEHHRQVQGERDHRVRPRQRLNREDGRHCHVWRGTANQDPGPRHG